MARKDFEQEVRTRQIGLDKAEAFRKQRVASLGFHDDTKSPLCVTPPPTQPADIDVDRSLWIHDRATLDAADFSLTRVLGTLAEQAAAAGADGTTAESLFTELWETQNHCDDPINGFKTDCRPTEGKQAKDPSVQITKYTPIGLVNRLDLAHEGWRNCGEHRIVFGRNDTSTQKALGRAFIIFEAVLPNPRPGCRSACEPVAEFWKSLSNPTLSPATRALLLHAFYFDGLPGFDKVVHIDHYTSEGVSSLYGSSGSGQIRMNLFMALPWVLKEFRLELHGIAPTAQLSVIPTMTKVAPFARLWSERIAADSSDDLSGLATGFQAELLGNVASLAVERNGTCPGAAGPDINQFSYPVSSEFDDAQGHPQDPAPFDIYQFMLVRDKQLFVQPPLPDFFREKLASSPHRCGLTGDQLASRAQALSCAGCHEPTAFFLNSENIGPATLPGGAPASGWPGSLGFVHTNERAVNGVHELSPALTTAFLPERKRFLIDDVLNQPTCPCTETFVKLPPGDLAHRATTIEEEVTRKLAKQIGVEKARLEAAYKLPPGPQRIEAVKQAQGRMRALERKREQDRTRALEAAGIRLPPVDREPKIEPRRTAADTIAEGDPGKARLMLQNQIMGELRAEPPRRTVTGSFRVH